VNPAAPLAFPLAVITGAGHRLGRALALEYARQGYAIGLHFNRSDERAAKTMGELIEAGSPIVHLLQADLTKPAEIEAMFQHLGGLVQPLRVLVNCAAEMHTGSLRTMSVDEWDAQMNLNLRAPWLCAREAARIMPPGGCIINITESGVHKTWTRYPVYILSKNALETLTRLLAKDLAPNIRVNALAPGLILPPDDMPAAEWQKLVERLPLRQAGTPAEVARAALFLTQNEHITGTTLVVDGGYQLV
jgi:pteridine reductase